MGLETAIYDAILRTDSRYQQMMKIRCEVLAFDAAKRVVTVRIEQFKKYTDKVFTDKELVEKAKEVFSHLPESFTVHYRALTWKGEGIEAISADWVRNQMKKYDLKQTDIVEAFGLDKAVLSKLLNNRYEFTRWHKVAFWYYFKYLSKMK